MEESYLPHDLFFSKKERKKKSTGTQNLAVAGNQIEFW
jgi:hypothetical protein